LSYCHGGIRIATIFLIDDDEALHEIYRDLFAIKGHTLVASAFNGAEAIEIYVKLDPKPDVILMDHRMPIMDGISATKELKRIDPSCKIIFLSADESAMDEALAAGAASFKLKPVSSSDLFEAISQVLKSS